MARKPNLVDLYFAEVVNYGGLPATRAEVYRDLREKGLDEKQIDLYMFRLNQRHDVEQGRCIQTGPNTWLYGARGG